MNNHQKGRCFVPFLTAFSIACVFAPRAAAQMPELKTLEIFSDNACQVTLGTFTVPPGQTATNFVFSYQTSWQACQGPDHMDWITFGIRGGLTGAPLYERTEYFDQRPAAGKPRTDRRDRRRARDVRSSIFCPVGIPPSAWPSACRGSRTAPARGKPKSNP